MTSVSSLYECDIAHARTKPRPHYFLQRHFMMYLALDELDCLHSQMRLFGKRWLSPYSFDPADHMPDTSRLPLLQDRVRRFVQEGGVKEQISSINLLTNVRCFGYVFNPVSFFFCFDGKGESVCCVAEVGNTFGEKKAYLLRNCVNSVFRDRQQKLFYISPFTELGQDLVFDLAVPSEILDMRVDTMNGEEKVVATSMRGQRLPLTDENLLSLTWRYPWAPARVIALIHFHAVMLWLKRIPHHRKEEDIEQQVGVMHPHHSLTSRAIAK
jgi:uncharacterized protein